MRSTLTKGYVNLIYKRVKKIDDPVLVTLSCMLGNSLENMCKCYRDSDIELTFVISVPDSKCGNAIVETIEIPIKLLKELKELEEK